MVECKKICKEFKVKQNPVVIEIVMSRHWLNFWCLNRTSFCSDMLSFCHDKVGAKIDKHEKVFRDIFSMTQQTANLGLIKHIATRFLYVAT